MATIASTSYCTVRQVIDFVHLFTEVPTIVSSNTVVGGEDVGIGNGSTTIFSLANRKVVQSSESIYVSGTLKTVTTDYTIDYDSGIITFVSAPALAAIVTSSYLFSDLESSLIAKHITRAENEIERRVGRKFSSNNATLDYYDGVNSSVSGVMTYEPSRFLDEMQTYKRDDNYFAINKSFFTVNYPIQNVYVVGVNKATDQTYSNTNQDANQAFGGVNWAAQGFTAGVAKQIIGGRLYLKFNTGTGSTITVGLYATSGGVPTGSALATSSITTPSDAFYHYYDFYFSNPYAMSTGTVYALVASSPSATSSAFHWGIDSSSATYTGGTFATSVNSGSSWSAASTTDAVFDTYIVDQVLSSSDFVVYPDSGRINLTTSSTGLIIQGIQNMVIAYSYGYSSVPLIVEELCTKLASVYCVESRLMGDPASSLSIPAQNIDSIKKDIERLWGSLGEKWELRLVQ